MALSNPPLVLVPCLVSPCQSNIPRGYTQQSELSGHWRCYLLALRTASDLARTLMAMHSTSNSSTTTVHSAAGAGGGGTATASWRTSRSSNGSSSYSWGGVREGGGKGMGQREAAEAGLAQVFLFIETFRPTMVEGLSTLPPSANPAPAAAAAAAGFGGGGGGGGRLTLALMQERVDVVGVVAALGPWMARWRAQHPDTSTDLLEVRLLFCFFL